MLNGEWEETADSMPSDDCPEKPQRCNDIIWVVRESTNNWEEELNYAIDINTTVTYTCNLDGSKVTSKCQSNGKWSQPMPNACPISAYCCAADPYLSVDVVNRTWNDSHDLGAEAVYDCVLRRIPGQEMTEIKSHCQDDGMWSEVNSIIDRVCRKSICYDPEFLDGLVLNGDFLGDVATQRGPLRKSICRGGHKVGEGEG